MQYSLECPKNVVSSNGNILEYLTEAYRGWKEIVLQAVKQDGNILEYTKNIFRRDRNVVLVAILRTPEVLKFAELPLNQNLQLLIKAGL